MLPNAEYEREPCRARGGKLFCLCWDGEQMREPCPYINPPPNDRSAP
jgi:hypothetical protein